MKNTKLKIITTLLLILSLTFNISCSRGESNEIEKNSLSGPENNMMARLSDNDLISALSEDEDFRALSDMIAFFDNMPNKENYLQKFDKETLEAQEDDTYFISISGYSASEVENARVSVNEHMRAIYSKFPQLTEYNEEELYVVIESASNIYYDSFGTLNKIKCSTCAKIGRAKMVFYTATGAATCGALGGPFALYTGWACGVAGFATAGYETLGCLEDCQK